MEGAGCEAYPGAWPALLEELVESLTAALYVGPTPDSLPKERPALSWAFSLHSLVAARASASTAGGSLVAFEVSVVLAVVEREGWDIGPRASELAAKLPPSLIDSPARESEVTTPGFSFLGSWKVLGSEVTWKHC